MYKGKANDENSVVLSDLTEILHTRSASLQKKLSLVDLKIRFSNILEKIHFGNLHEI